MIHIIKSDEFLIGTRLILDYLKLAPESTEDLAFCIVGQVSTYYEDDTNEPYDYVRLYDQHTDDYVVGYRTADLVKLKLCVSYDDLNMEEKTIYKLGGFKALLNQITHP